MARAFIVVLIASLAVSGCGGSSPPAPGPTPSSGAVQQTDLPRGMGKCDLTGDIDRFLNKEKTAHPSTYQSTKTGRGAAKTKPANGHPDFLHRGRAKKFVHGHPGHPKHRRDRQQESGDGRERQDQVAGATDVVPLIWVGACGPLE